MKSYYKYILIIILLFFPPVSTSAQTVSKKIASEVSNNFYFYFYNNQPEINSIEYKTINDTICYYKVFYRDSGWCIVSADYTIEPILAFGNSIIGTDTVFAFREILEWYADQIISKLRSDSFREEHPHWRQLLSVKRNSQNYQDSGLLDWTGRGRNMWGQQFNNNNIINYYDDYCNPTYNADCPEDSWYNTQCECGHKPVGCGAVAIGQLMWYWKWPKDIHWEEIPGTLTRATPSNQANALTGYLRECGNDVNMHYMCAGSWTTMDNIADALQNKGYQGIKKYHMNDWLYGKSWENLIKSEIDNKRPVIMYGESFTFVTGHYFVIDDYYVNSYDTWFHINWGHRHNCNGYCKIDRLVEHNSNSNDYFNINNKVLVGISPTYNANEISSLPYNVISRNESRTEYAYERIVIPDENGLIVEQGAGFTAESGKEIILKPGFEAKEGSSVNLSIDKKWQTQMAISVPTWQNTYDPFDENPYWLKVFNADSWEFTLYDINADYLFQNAGSVTDTIVQLWDGTNGYYGTFFCTIAFKNSYGRRLENTFTLLLQPNSSFSNEATDSLGLRTLQTHTSFIDNSDTNSIVVYPNPTSGIVCFKLDGDTIKNILIYDQMGRSCYSDKNINNDIYRANLRGFQKSNYFVIIEGWRKTYKRIISYH